MRGLQTWRPPFLEGLEREAIKASVINKRVMPSNFGLSVFGLEGERKVRGMPSAMSKVHLAKFCGGMTDSGESYARASEDLIAGYSALLIVTVSVVALETYLRMRGGIDLRSCRLDQSDVDYSEVGRAVWQQLTVSGIYKIHRSLERNGLKTEIDEFGKRDYSRVLSLCYALRNTFAHGKMGLENSIDLPSAYSLRSMMMGLIEEDASRIKKSLHADEVIPSLVWFKGQ